MQFWLILPPPLSKIKSIKHQADFVSHPGLQHHTLSGGPKKPFLKALKKKKTFAFEYFVLTTTSLLHFMNFLISRLLTNSDATSVQDVGWTTGSIWLSSQPARLTRWDKQHNTTELKNKTGDTKNKQMLCSQTVKEPEESPLLCDALLLQVRYRVGNLRSGHLKTAEI